MLVKYGVKTYTKQNYIKLLRTVGVVRCLCARAPTYRAAQLIERGAVVTANADGETPVHVATRAGNVTALECLLRDTAVDVEAKTAQLGWTALHMAARAGATEAATLLIKHGADLRTLARASRDAPPDAPLVTPVQLATTHAHADCERLLRDRERDAVQLASTSSSSSSFVRLFKV